MSYRVEFSPIVKKQLRNMDKYQAILITRWLYRNVDGRENPRKYGKSLSDDTYRWKYKVGNYSVVVEIESERIVVTTIYTW